MGANVQSRPILEASSAAILADVSMASRSQEQDSPKGLGKMVR